MQVKPFRAYRFNEAVVGDANRCIAPPYDVIDAQTQNELFDSSEYNIARITKGRTHAGDDENNNVYTRAADYLKKWIEQGALVQDAQNAIYGYVQNFEIQGKSYQRYNFVASARLEELGKGVRAHETTLSKPRADRLNLLRATKAVFGLVYLMYDDPQQVAERVIAEALADKTLIDYTDSAGVRHRLTVVPEGPDTQAISAMMAEKTCIIADGHHRYETALEYARQSGQENAWCQMLAFANTAQEGMIVLATHRLLGGLENFDSQELVKGLSEHFELTRFDFDCPAAAKQARQKMLEAMEAQFKQRNCCFGIYLGNGAYYAAVLKDLSIMAQAAPQAAPAWQELDVAVLHKLIIERLLGLDEEKVAQGGNIEYIKDDGSGVAQAVEAVETGVKQAAFFMNSPRIEQIMKVAQAGEKMPQKSTFFYPKVYTGLTINKL